MEIRLLLPNEAQTWDEFCRESEDAWLWHTAEWMAYSEAYCADRFVKNTSFLVNEGDVIQAAFPCLIEMRPNREKVLSSGSTPCPWPVFKSGLSHKERSRVEDAVFENLFNITKENGVNRIEMFGSVLSPSFYRSAFPPANLPTRHGFQGILEDTQMIQLSKTEENLWQEVRKGHKSSIKAGQKSLVFRCYLGDVPEDVFQSYQQLHSEAAGRQTRRQKTFDLMKRWINKKYGLLVGVKEKNQWVGFSYFMVYKKGAFYASACKKPDLSPSNPVGQILVWSAMMELKKRGIEMLEMGLQHYKSIHDHGADDKIINISRFKRGFGGFPMPRYVSSINMPTYTEN